MKIYWVIGALLATGLPVQVEACTVDVFLKTGTALPVFLQPQVKVTQMFREIGVDVQVRTRRLPQDNDTCGLPITMMLDDATGYPGTPDALAYSTPFIDSGACIHVFLDRVMRRNRDPGFVNILLAHVMVHEITHVLEQSIYHSQEGVMKARWNREDYQNMRRHTLPFSPEDVIWLHNGIAKRIARITDSKMASE